MFNGLSLGYVLPWKVTMKNITHTFFSFGGSERINFRLIEVFGI